LDPFTATFRTSDQAVVAGNSGEQGASAILGSEEQPFLKDYEAFVKSFISTKNLGKEEEEALEKILSEMFQTYLKVPRDNHAQALKSFTDHIIDIYRVILVSVVEGKPRTPVQPEGGPHSSGVYGGKIVFQVKTSTCCNKKTQIFCVLTKCRWRFDCLIFERTSIETSLFKSVYLSIFSQGLWSNCSRNPFFYEFSLNLQYWYQSRLEKFYNRNCNKIFSEVLMVLFSPELNIFCSILDLVTRIERTEK